jgi:hypothetical protein
MALVWFTVIFTILFAIWLRWSHTPAKTVCAAAPGTNCREFQRIPLETRLEICWQDQDGCSRTIRGRAVDISEFGASMKCFRPLPAEAVVFVEARRYNLAGPALVRRCERRGLRYQIGLEFTSPWMRRL